MEPERNTGDRLCSVIIPTWKRADRLKEVLDSLASQTSSDFEVIVVSDGEDRLTRELATSFHAPFPLEFHFHATNRGQAAARNTGAQRARGDILVFLDDDTLANATLIERHLLRHNSTGSAGPIAVVGRITEERIGPVTRPTDRFLQKNWEQTLKSYAELLAATGFDSVGEQFEASVAFGLNCSIARGVFLRNGGFKEALRTTDEDMELGIRFYLAGVLFVFESEAIVTHRSAKDLTDYLQSCWQASGKSDMERVLSFGQRNSQTSRLVSMHRGGTLHRVASKALWHGSGTLRAAAKRLESAANATGSGVLLRAWGRIAPSATYWDSVKSTGCTLDELKQAAGQPKRALTLHSISAPQTPQESRYYISPNRFRKFFQWFRNAGYKTVNADAWLQGQVGAKRVLVTFDDGYDDLYTEMFPLFAESGFTALVFLVANQIGASNLWDQKSGVRPRNLLTAEQIREMQRYGIEFGSHTVTHPYLPEVSDGELRSELENSKHRLEDLLGVAVTSFAYPYGGVDRRIRSAVVNAGYTQAFTTLPGSNWWNDPFTQRRAETNDYTSFLDFRWKVRTGLTFTASLGERLRNLQRTLPTAFLRNIAGALGRIGHTTAQSISRETQGRMRT